MTFGSAMGLVVGAFFGVAGFDCLVLVWVYLLLCASLGWILVWLIWLCW